MTSAKPEDVNAAEGDVTFLAEGEWDTYKDDPLAVEVKEKAEKKIIALHERIRALDAEMIDVKVKNEHLFIELESKFEAVSAELAETKVSQHKLTDEHQDTSVREKQLEDRVHDLVKALGEKEAKLTELTKSTDELHSERRTMLNSINEKNSRIKLLEEEVRAMTEGRVDSASASSELNIRVQRQEAELLSLQLKSSRLDQENASLIKHNKWLEEELQSRSDELLQTRKDKSSQLFERAAQAEEAEAENKILKESVNTLRTRNVELEALVGKYMDDIRSAQDELQLTKEQFESEINIRNRLVQLHEDKATEAGSKAKELEVVVEQAKASMSSIKQQYEEQLSRVLEEKHKIADKYAKAADEVKELKQRLSTINASVQAGSGSPLPPGANLALTLQHKYEEATKTTLLLKNENRRINSYLNQILKEVEEKAPIFEEQQEAYEKMQTEYTQMSQSLEQAMREMEVAKEQAEALKKENNDLAKQVQQLLAECMEKTGYPPRPAPPSSVSTASLESTDTIIPAELVTFKDIQEIQQNNRRLLRVVHKLEAEVDKKVELKTQEKMQEVYKRLEQLKAERAQITEKLQVVMRQRDMFKAIADLRQSPAAAVPSDPAIPEPSSNERRALAHADDSRMDFKPLYEDLQHEFDNYRKEKQKDDRDYQERIDKQREEMSQLRSEVVKAQSRQTFAEQRYEELKQTAEGQTNELKALRTRNAEYSASVGAHQMQIETIRQEMEVVQQESRRLREQVGILRAEKEALTKAEKRLVDDITGLRQEVAHNQSLSQNLQKFLAAREASEDALKKSSSQEVERLRSELQHARKVREEDDERIRDQLRAAELSNSELSQKLSEREKEMQQLREATIKHEATVQTLNNQIRSLQQQLLESERKGQRGVLRPAEGAATGEGISREAELVIAGLREELSQEREHLAHYRVIADDREKAMKELQETNDQYRATIEQRLKDTEAALKQSKETLAELHVKYEEQQAAFATYQETAGQEIENLHAQVTKVEKEKREMHSQLEEALSKEQALRQDLHVHKEMCAEAQNNYDREVMIHANSLSLLSKIKEDLSKQSHATREAVEKYEQLASATKIEKATWEEEQKSHQKELDELQARVADLKGQNEVLHAHLQSLMSKSAQIQAAAGEVSEGYTPSGEEKTIEELRQLVGYLKKEREIVECKHELAHQEATRYRQQWEHATRALDEVRGKLHAEQERTAQHLRSEAEHKDLVGQIGQLNLYRESNAMLRSEVEKLQAEVREWKTKYDELQKQVNPLLAGKRELVATIDGLKLEIKSLVEERDRWKKRMEDYQANIKRIDPEEHRKITEKAQQLEEELATTKTQLEEAQKELARLRQEFDEKTVELQRAVNYGKTAKPLLDKLKAALDAQKEQTEKNAQACAEATTKLESCLKQLAEKDRANAELTAEKEQLNKTLHEKDQKMEKIKILLRRQKQQQQLGGAGAAATPPATPPTFVPAPEPEAPAAPSSPAVPLATATATLTGKRGRPEAPEAAAGAPVPPLRAAATNNKRARVQEEAPTAEASAEGSVFATPPPSSDDMVLEAEKEKPAAAAPAAAPAPVYVAARARPLEAVPMGNRPGAPPSPTMVAKGPAQPSTPPTTATTGGDTPFPAGGRGTRGRGRGQMRGAVEQAPARGRGAARGGRGGSPAPATAAPVTPPPAAAATTPTPTPLSRAFAAAGMKRKATEEPATPEAEPAATTPVAAAPAVPSGPQGRWAKRGGLRQPPAAAAAPVSAPAQVPAAAAAAEPAAPAPAVVAAPAAPVEPVALAPSAAPAPTLVSITDPSVTIPTPSVFSLPETPKPAAAATAEAVPTPAAPAQVQEEATAFPVPPTFSRVEAPTAMETEEAPAPPKVQAEPEQTTDDEGEEEQEQEEKRDQEEEEEVEEREEEEGEEGERSEEEEGSGEEEGEGEGDGGEDASNSEDEDEDEDGGSVF